MPTLDLDVSTSVDDSWQGDVGGDGRPAEGGNLLRGDSAGGFMKYFAARWQVTGPGSGATVSTAHISWFSDQGNIAANVYCEAADSAASFTTGTNDISGRTLTGGVADWSGTLAAPNGFHDSVAISTVVQEVFARAGWASGNYLVVVLVGSSSNTATTANCWDGSTGWAPKIHIEYTAAGGALSSQLVEAAQTFTGIPIKQAKKYLTAY
jgi:hypothetical protein